MVVDDGANMSSSASGSSERERVMEADQKIPVTSFSRELPREYELDGVDDLNDDYHRHVGYTRNDKTDMHRMVRGVSSWISFPTSYIVDRKLQGKVQELKRNFRPFSAMAFVIVLQGTWEVLLAGSSQGLQDGGIAGLLWSYVWTFFGFGTIVLSLAEMSSMAPTAGGQYHWVSEFAPATYQKPLSYFIGWMAALSWQAGQATGPFLVGTLIQGMISVNNPDYEPTNWQGTLLVWAVVVLTYVLNVWGNDAMPLINNVFLVVHFMGFLAIVVTLWTLSPRNTADVVFTQFANGGGFSSLGLALMVGQLSAIYGLICSDSAAHISEEVSDAGSTVPKTMVYSYVINAVLGLIMLVTFLFMLTDLDAANNDITGFAILWVFKNAVSTAGVNVLGLVLIAMVFAGTVSFNISTSRQTWSFARDHGLPWSRWIAHVDRKKELPVRAIQISCGFTVLMSLINFGSDVAFGAIVSLNLVSLMLTYAVSIACVLARRIQHPELLPRSRWSLGKMGIPVNVAALLYSTFAFFWCFWPSEVPVALNTFNWSIVMFVALAVWSVVYYFMKGRRVFDGPVVLTEGWKSR